MQLYYLSVNKTYKENYVLPKWEKGDCRFIQTEFSSFSRMNNDTISNLAGNKTYKFTVISVSKDFYVIEMQNTSEPVFDFTLDIDVLP